MQFKVRMLENRRNSIFKDKQRRNKVPLMIFNVKDVPIAFFDSLRK